MNKSVTRSYKLLGFLREFKCDRKEIQLEQDLKISKGTAEESNQVKPLTEQYHTSIPEYALKKESFTLDIPEDKSLPSSNLILELDRQDKLEARTEFEDVITLLRLFKKNDDFGGGIFAAIPLDKDEGVSSSIIGLLPLLPISFRIAPSVYELQGSEIDRFRTFWAEHRRSLSNIRKNGEEIWGFLKIALRRYNLSYEREHLEDRFLDYMISFEALYGTKCEKTEITHRISTRFARVLGRRYKEEYEKCNEERKSNNSRDKLRRKMKEFYDVRSRVVHGGKFKSKGKSKGFSLEEVKEYLRESTLIFIALAESGCKHDQLLKDIDLYELDGLPCS